MTPITHPQVQFVDLRFRRRSWIAAAAAVVAIGIPAAFVAAPKDDPKSHDQAVAGDTFGHRP